MAKLRWFRLLLVLPLLAGLIGTNIYQDPANLYHDESKSMAEAIVAGNAVYNGTSNLNERELKRNLVASMPDEVDTIALGPSLVMCVSAEDAGTDSYYNLGVSASDLYDILAQLGMMEVYGKKYHRVILCVDSYSFDEAIYDYEKAANKAYRPYAEYMLDRMEGKRPETIQTDEQSTLQTRVEQAVSLSYFQACCNQIRKNKTFSMADYRWGVVAEDFNGEKPYYSPDGSWNYTARIQAQDAEYVKSDAATYDLKAPLAYERHISNYSMEIYEKLITYLQEEGVEVELFLCPLSVSLWDKMQPDIARYPIVYEISDYAKALAETYKLKITGSFDPYEVGMTDADFYDCRHVRKEKLSKYFDFKAK